MTFGNSWMVLMSHRSHRMSGTVTAVTPFVRWSSGGTKGFANAKTVGGVPAGGN
jgi:hypothetical protein